MQNSLKFVIKYNNKYFIFLSISLCIAILSLVIPLFFIEFNNHISIILKEYLFSGGSIVYKIRILSFPLVFSLFLYPKEWYSMISLGDIYLYNDHLECFPKYFFNKKTMYYKDLYILNKQKSFYIKQISTLVIIDKNYKKRKTLSIYVKSSIFFLISSSSINSKEELIEIYDFLTNKILATCKNGV